MSAINQCKWFDSTLHIFGLLSDGGVHSHIDHMLSLIHIFAVLVFEALRQTGFENLKLAGPFPQA